MRRSLTTASFLASSLFCAASAESLWPEARSEYSSTCTEIEQAISNVSTVHWPCMYPREHPSSFYRANSCMYLDLGLNAAYQKDIGHWALSSTAQAACSVEPGSAADVGKIVRHIFRYCLPPTGR